jgi:hypothetical protein
MPQNVSSSDISEEYNSKTASQVMCGSVFCTSFVSVLILANKETLTVIKSIAQAGLVHFSFCVISL